MEPLIKFLYIKLQTRPHISKGNNKCEQGYEINILFHCTYLETKITFHVYEKLSLKTNMPHICKFQRHECLFLFSLQTFFMFGFILES
jgi:hypothetical protein